MLSLIFDTMSMSKEDKNEKTILQTNFDEHGCEYDHSMHLFSSENGLRKRNML